MTGPEGAPEAIYDYQWKFKVDGGEKIVVTNGSYPQVEGEFIGVETELVQEGYVPPIHDFAMERNGEDFTEELLHEEKLIMIVAYSLGRSEAKGLAKMGAIAENAKSKGYRVIGLSASGEELKAEVKEKYHLDFDFYFSDETALKTIIRSNPGIVRLNRGTIQQKLHWSDAEKLEL